MFAAGGRLAHLPEPRTESLETGLGTYADQIQLLWTLLADRGASGGIVFGIVFGIVLQWG